MNNEEILNKYIDLIDKGYCCACNELNCIDNFPHAKITHAIRELQQENKQLKSQWCKLKEYLHNVDVVIDYSENYDGRFINYDELLDKMQELEGSDSNGQ